MFGEAICILIFCKQYITLLLLCQIVTTANTCTKCGAANSAQVLVVHSGTHCVTRVERHSDTLNQADLGSFVESMRAYDIIYILPLVCGVAGGWC